MCDDCLGEIPSQKASVDYNGHDGTLKCEKLFTLNLAYHCSGMRFCSDGFLSGYVR